MTEKKAFPYLPDTEADIKEMLEFIGVESIEELFSPIPSVIRLRAPLDLPPPMSEPRLVSHIKEVAGRNIDPERWDIFLGGGIYLHFIPSVVNAIASLPGFYTPYTPYQPEASQGTLQAIYEYQSMMCMLSGMDVSNASMYDGASASAEAVLMAARISKKKRVFMSQGLNPQYQQVIRTYTAGTDLELKYLPLKPDGTTAVDATPDETDLAAVVFQSPNYFGCIEDARSLAEQAHAVGALAIQCTTEPLSLALVTPPGEAGVDIFAAEGQSFGMPPCFGGPALGVMACRQEFVRQMPGRLVGRTKDRSGRDCYVLTLAAREQHIRRAKATSNICTNESLMALRAAVYISALGEKCLMELAKTNAIKAHYAEELISSLPGYERAFRAPFFNEFTIKTPVPAKDVIRSLRRKKIYCGLDVTGAMPGGGDALLICVTEVNSKEAIDRLVAALKEVKG